MSMSMIQDLRTNIPALAINEAGHSNLPGKDGGPYDAYRHILWTAEMTRRYGESTARLLAEWHEAEGRRAGQSIERQNMDRWNNETGYDIGKQSKSWEEVVQRARRAMEESARGAGVTDPNQGGGVRRLDLQPAGWTHVNGSVST